MIIAADFTAITLRPLKALQIPYLTWMDYSHFLIPGGSGVLWLTLKRKWPNAGAAVAVVLCFVLVGLIPRYAESRIAKVRVNRWIDQAELRSIEATVGVPVFERGTREGTFVLVAPAHEQRLRAELAKLQRLGE